MSKILKGVKGLFFKEVQSSKEEKKKPASEQETVEETSSSQKVPEMSLTLQDIEGDVDDRFIDILLKALNKVNLSGFDYLEYRKSLISLREMDMTEKNRYQSAYVMAKTMNADLKSLKNSADHYLEALKEEDREFEEALIKRKNSVLSSKKEEISGLESSINDKREKIKHLEREISEEEKRVEQLKSELTSEEEKLMVTKANFMKSYQHLKNQIELDKANIAQYLSEEN